MNYITGSDKDQQLIKRDEIVVTKGDTPINVYIDPSAIMNIVGTVMDFEESTIGMEFTFNNPNAKGECGCGESFNV